MECDDVRRLAPELALGIADGAERAAALRHLAGCPECRRTLEELSELSDELLLLAPEHEPPAGFESRALARIHPPRRRERSLRRHRVLLSSMCSAIAAAAVTAAVIVGATGQDRRLAAQYQKTLAVAHGSYFEAATLRDPTGDRAGVVFGYRGSPSWVFAELDAPYRSGGYAAQLVLASGRRIPLDRLRINTSRGSAGQAIPVDLHRVNVVRFIGRAPGDVLEATLPHAPGGAR
jgi:hypothetical protein